MNNQKAAVYSCNCPVCENEVSYFQMIGNTITAVCMYCGRRITIIIGKKNDGFKIS